MPISLANTVPRIVTDTPKRLSTTGGGFRRPTRDSVPKKRANKAEQKLSSCSIPRDSLVHLSTDAIYLLHDQLKSRWKNGGKQDEPDVKLRGTTRPLKVQITATPEIQKLQLKSQNRTEMFIIAPGATCFITIVAGRFVYYPFIRFHRPLADSAAGFISSGKPIFQSARRASGRRGARRSRRNRGGIERAASRGRGRPAGRSVGRGR